MCSVCVILPVLLWGEQRRVEACECGTPYSWRGCAGIRARLWLHRYWDSSLYNNTDPLTWRVLQPGSAMLIVKAGDSAFCTPQNGAAQAPLCAQPS